MFWLNFSFSIIFLCWIKMKNLLNIYQFIFSCGVTIFYESISWCPKWILILILNLYYLLSFWNRNSTKHVMIWHIQAIYWLIRVWVRISFGNSIEFRHCISTHIFQINGLTYCRIAQKWSTFQIWYVNHQIWDPQRRHSTLFRPNISTFISTWIQILNVKVSMSCIKSWAIL